MRRNATLDYLLAGGAYITLGLLVLIVTFIFLKSWPFLADTGIHHLWSDNHWQPLEQQFNMLPMVVGSVLIMLAAVLLAAPIGIFLAIFLCYYSPPYLSSIYQHIIELLAGIPSVVYGLWGLVVLVPAIALWVPPGASVLAASIVLAIMILPLIVLVTDSAFKETPPQWLAAADALALSTWGKVWHIVLPHASSSIISGTILQAGRAIGETMAVLMVCGNIVQIPSSLFEPARTLTANIALEMSYASAHHTSALFVSGLLLLLIAILLVSIAHYWRTQKVAYHA